MEQGRIPNLLIDGYNLIHAISSLAYFVPSDLQRARELLLLKLSAYATRKQVKIIVVFDGKAGDFPGQNPQPGLIVVFTRGEKADQKIKELARQISQKKDWLVITSDFDIRYQVETWGLKSRSSQDFASELAACTRPKKALKKSAPAQPEEKKMTRQDLDWAYEVFLK
ncbi:MAG: NYN domain-containing protein, partial [Candidatus Aminicenantes bacterium]|nr:NYN domain-containing protein [Candidatus Aminicenantes bacterium]